MVSIPILWNALAMDWIGIQCNGFQCIPLGTSPRPGAVPGKTQRSAGGFHYNPVNATNHSPAAPNWSRPCALPTPSTSRRCTAVATIINDYPLTATKSATVANPVETMAARFVEDPGRPCILLDGVIMK